jgi:hypothetical protein
MPGRILTPEATALIDFSSLDAVVTPADVRDYKHEITSPLQRRVDRGSMGLHVTLLALCTVAAVGVLATVAGLFIVGVADVTTVVEFGLLIFFAGLTIAALVSTMVRDFPLRVSWRQRVQRSRFADANGLSYAPVAAGINYPGIIFAAPERGTRFDVFTVKSGRRIQFGNYRRSRSSFEGAAVRWGYLMIELDRRLPHMVLISKGGRRQGPVPLGVKFQRSQAMSLEGDFDRYFTLYAPREYERDALYVFTPDLMALLIDRVAQFDVEIVDNWLFFYSRQPFDFSKRSVHRKVAALTRLVGFKAMNQTAAYADSAVGHPGANIVAPRGRRLRRQVAVGAGTSLGIFLAIRLILAFSTLHGG